MIKRDSTTRDPDMLRTCNDVPVERFVAIWTKDQQNYKNVEKKSDKASNGSIDGKSIAGGAGKIRPESSAREHHAVPASEHPVAKRLKAEQTRAANKRKKAVDQKDKLGSDDIRGDGAAASLVAGLKDLLNLRK